jgi:hypothetical protein
MAATVILRPRYGNKELRTSGMGEKKVIIGSQKVFADRKIQQVLKMEKKMDLSYRTTVEQAVCVPKSADCAATRFDCHCAMKML